MRFRGRGSGSAANGGCLVLFSLPFAGIGVLMLVLVAKDLVGATAMKSWHEVSGTVTEAELVVSRSDGATYKATATYTYEWKGKEYTNDRVSRSGGSDNIGSLQQDWGKKLERHQKSGQPIPVYVNPKDPTDSILDRSVRMGMVAFKGVFALVFGGAGFGIMIGGLLSTRKNKAGKAEAKAHPNEPWLWNKKWAGGVIGSENKVTMWVLIGFATFWNLISFPLAVVLYREVSEKKAEPISLIGLIFPVVGIGLIAAAVYQVFRYRKFGRSTFHMASVPGVLGGELTGAVQVPSHVEAAEGFLLQLSSVKLVTTGSGDNRSTSEHILWQSEQVVDRPAGTSNLQTLIPVQFTIPYELHESDPDDNPRIFWRLRASCELPGIDFSTSFKVPVFRTDASNPDLTEEDIPAVSNAYQREIEPAELAQLEKVFLNQYTDSGMDIRVPPARHKGLIFMGLFFAIIWTGICTGLWLANAPLLFPIVFSAVGCLIWWGVLESSLSSSSLNISYNGITVRKGWFGGGRTKTYAFQDCDRFKQATGMQSGNTVYKNIRLHLTNGKKIAVVKLIKDPNFTKWLVSELNAYLPEHTP